jgi:hypothetical protein
VSEVLALSWVNLMLRRNPKKLALPSSHFFIVFTT